MTYIMSCVWLDYMVKYFQCKNCVGSSLKTKKCVASFLVPGDKKKRQFSKEDCRFFLVSSLLAFHFSLFSLIVVSREKIREKREEKR